MKEIYKLVFTSLKATAVLAVEILLFSAAASINNPILGGIFLFIFAWILIFCIIYISEKVL